MENGQHSSYIPKEDDLNAENWQRSLEISAPLDMPAPENFTKVEAPIISSEAPTSPIEEPRISEPVATEAEAESSALGQITPVEGQSSSSVARVNYNPANVKITDGRLDKATMVEITNVENQLSQTHDLNNFYEEIRGEDGMVDASLKSLRGEKK